MHESSNWRTVCCLDLILYAHPKSLLYLKNREVSQMPLKQETATWFAIWKDDFSHRVGLDQKLSFHNCSVYRGVINGMANGLPRCNSHLDHNLGMAQPLRKESLLRIMGGT